MDIAIIHITDLAQGRPRKRPEKLSTAQKAANRILQTPIESVSEIGASRESLFSSQHRPHYLSDPKALDLFGDAVKSALIAQDVPLVLKRLQLFVFLSYIAVVEKRLTESILLNEKSRDDKKKEMKKLKGSIMERNLTFQKDRDAIERIYEAVEDLEKAIREYDKIITKLDSDKERLNKTMVAALQGNPAEKDIRGELASYLKGLRTGALNLHGVIDGLVKKGWTPAQATMSIIRRVPVRLWIYRSIVSTCVEPLVAGLMSEGVPDLTPSQSNTGDSYSRICIAKELVNLDSSLELQQTHKDLGYDFGHCVDSPCTACLPEHPPTIDTDSAVKQTCEADSASGTATLRRAPQPPQSRDCGSITLGLNTGLSEAEVNFYETEHVKHGAGSSHSLQLSRRIDNPKKTRFASTLKPCAKRSQSLHAASISATPQERSRISSPSKLQHQASLTSGYTHHAILGRPVASAQGSVSLYDLQPNPRETGLEHTVGLRDRLYFDPAPIRPDPPLRLPLSELLYTVRSYFENSCRNLNLDDQGVLLTQAGVKRRNDPCDSFDSYCHNASIFARNGMLIELGQALNKACTYVDDILQDDHPRALTCFFEVFIHLIQSGLPDCTVQLLRYTMRLYEIRGRHPLGRIYRLLSELDEHLLPQAMATAWWCTSNTFDHALGSCSSLAVSVRLDYIKRVHGVENYLDEERLLRTLLARLARLDGTLHPSVPRVMLNLAHNMNKQGRYGHARALARHVLALIREHKEYADKTAESIESWKVIAISHHAQESMVDAESAQRCAIGLIKDVWGRQHAWLAEFMNVLETWLRGWGRSMEANIVRTEITQLMAENQWQEVVVRSR